MREPIETCNAGCNVGTAPPGAANRWQKTAPLRALLVAALAAAALVGCQAGPSHGDANNNTVAPECESDADCVAGGEVCSPHRVCLPRARGSLPLAIALGPVENDGSAPRRTEYGIPPLELTVEDGVARVTYPEGRLLSGAVMVVNDVEVALQATLTASRPSRIPGRPKVTASRSVLAEGFLLRPDPNEVDTSFDLVLLPDITYTVRATPESPYDEKYHPLMRDVTLEHDEEQWFMFGDPEQSIHVAGAVLDALGAPVNGVRVKAVDEETGLYISSTGITDETGTFHLLMPAGIRSYRLTFGPSDENGTVPVIVQSGVIIGDTAAQQGPENAYDNPESLEPIHLPAFPTPVPFTFLLQGRGSDGTIQPAAGVSVTFETTVGHESSVEGIYRVSGVTNNEGEVELELIPGDSTRNRSYDVTVITPVDEEHEFASTVLEGEHAVKVGTSGGAITLELDRRVPFSSSVSSSWEGDLSGVTVQARRLDGPEALRNTLRSAVTKETGRFNLKLDPGQYNLEILPPTGLPLPRWVIQEPLEVLPDELPASFVDGLTLPDAAVLQVQVTGDGATPAPKANVRVSVYLVDDFCATLNPVDYHTCDVDSVLLGEAITDADGRARVLVPDTANE